MPKSKKIETINQQIKELQEKKNLLEQQELHELVKLIKKTNAHTLSQEVLVGVLLDAAQAFKEKESIIEKWQQHGKTLFEETGKKRKKTIEESDKDNSFRTPSVNQKENPQMQLSN